MCCLFGLYDYGGTLSREAEEPDDCGFGRRQRGARD